MKPIGILVVLILLTVFLGEFRECNEGYEVTLFSLSEKIGGIGVLRMLEFWDAGKELRPFTTCQKMSSREIFTKPGKNHDPFLPISA